MEIGGIPPVAGGKIDPDPGKKLKENPADTFLAYMAKTPAEHMRDAWLARQGITAEELAAMSPAEREAIEQRIAADIKKELQEEAQKRAAKAANPQLALSTLLATHL